MPEYEPLDYRLRCHTKRTDLPPDVLRDIGEAYEAIQRLTTERDEARRWICEEIAHQHETVWNDGERDFPPLLAVDVAISNGWDCFKEDGK